MPSLGAAAVLGQGHAWHRPPPTAVRAGCPLSHPDPRHPGGTDPHSAARRKVILHGHVVVAEALPSPPCRRDGAIDVIYLMAVHSQSSTQLFKKKKKKRKIRV